MFFTGMFERLRLSLCALPKDTTIDVSLSNGLFRDKGEKTKRKRCAKKEASHQNANKLEEWKEFYLNGSEKTDRGSSTITEAHSFPLRMNTETWKLNQSFFTELKMMSCIMTSLLSN